MSQIFHPNVNIIVRAVLLVVVLGVPGLAGLGSYLVRSPLVTEVGVARAQPVPYSHQQHVGGLGLDCRYCHSSVEESNVAAIPSSETCMGCHAQIATDSPLLQPVRTSYQENQPLAWIRVHELADYVYFNHAIHVRQGIGCESCHGRVDQMAVLVKAETLQMEWCLECHRAPERHIRPRSAVFTMGWEAPPNQLETGRQLIADYGIQVERLSDCSVCHR
jgi:hypothetical protein